jgi:hypothetical protein
MDMEFLHILIREGFSKQCPEKRKIGPMLMRSGSRALKIGTKGVEEF